MINTTKLSITTAAVMTILVSVFAIQAADLTVDSSYPSILFDDTDTSNTVFDWRLYGHDLDFGLLQVNPTVRTVMNIKSSTNNNSNSFTVDSSGDINLANGSVFIDRSSGSVGIGTTTPEESLHVADVSGNMILEWTGESKWLIGTVVGGGFALRNLMNFNFPFWIEGDAPTNSIRVGTAGVGIGTAIPAAKLDVAGDIKATFSGVNPNGTGLVEMLKMSVNNSSAGQFSDAGFAMENARAGFSWAFRTQENTGGFAASKQGTGAKEFEVRNNTNVAANVSLFLANGANNTLGQWNNASSRSYKKNIHELSNEEAMQTLHKLNSVKYQFKRDESEQQMVGFIAEDMPDLLASSDKKSVDPLQIVAVLTKALQAEVKDKDEKIAKMESQIAKLMLMQEKMTKTMEANFRPSLAKKYIVNHSKQVGSGASKSSY